MRTLQERRKAAAAMLLLMMQFMFIYCWFMTYMMRRAPSRNRDEERNDVLRGMTEESDPVCHKKLRMNIDEGSSQFPPIADDLSSTAHTSSSMPSVQRSTPSQKRKRNLTVMEEMTETLKELAAASRQLAASFALPDCKRISDAVMAIPNITKVDAIHCIDLLGQKAELANIFFSLEPEMQRAWLGKKLGRHL